MRLLFDLLLWLGSRCSQSVALRLSRGLAGVMTRLNTEGAQVTQINLQTCFPEADEQTRLALTRESLTHMALLFFEFAQLRYWPLERLLSRIDEVIGEPQLQTAFDSPRGVLLFVPHFGNWEMLCAFLGTHYSLAALYDPPKLASLEPTILAARQRYDARMFAIDTAGMRSLYRELRSGKLVGLLPDQVPERNAGVYAEFFGQPTLTMTLPYRLIQKTKPVVFMGAVERVVGDSHWRYRLRFEQLPDAAAFRDAQTTARILNDNVERFVRRDPSQYQWEYKRFKRPPVAGRRNIYRRQ